MGRGAGGWPTSPRRPAPTSSFTEFQAVDSDYDTTGLVANGSVWGVAKLNMIGSNGADLANLSTITGDGRAFSLTYKQPN